MNQGNHQAQDASLVNKDLNDLREQVEASITITPVPLDVSLKLFLSALTHLPRETVAQRRAIYQAIQTGQENGLAHAGADDVMTDFRYRQLRMIIRYLEQDIRAGIDVLAEDYQPTVLMREYQRLEAGYAARFEQKKARESSAADLSKVPHARPLTILTPSEHAEYNVLNTRLEHIHATQCIRPTQEGGWWFTTLGALLRFVVHVIHNESRIALIWAFLGPTLLLGLISAPYFLTGTRYILGMDVGTFSLLGAVTWVMLRQIIFRCSSNYIASRTLVHINLVTPLLHALAYALVYLCIYLVVYLVLLSAGAYLGLVTLPTQWITPLFYILAMALGATSIGILFGSIAAVWPYFLRLAAVIERTLQIFSSVFFVSEQLPEHYRPYFLWSPFAHGMQLLRSSYFENYHSYDASLSYFLITLLILATLSLLAERMARRNIQPM